MTDAVAKSVPLFDLPQWAQRRQLISHLLHNASGLIYLRGPSGAGKTRFLATLIEHLREDFQVAQLDAVAPAEALDAFARSAASTMLTRVGGAGRPVSGADEPALLVLDNADRCSNATLDGLQNIADNLGHLVLAGRGGPAVLTESNSIRWIDLPAFTEDQTRAFAARLDAGLVSRLGPEGIRALYLETSGLPGKIINRIAASGAGAYANAAGRLLVWLGAGLLILVMGWLVWEQDRVNAWLAKDAAESITPITTSSTEQSGPIHKAPVVALGPETPSKAEPPPVVGTPAVVEAPALVATPALVETPSVGGAQKPLPPRKPAPSPRKAPKIDLPTAEILRAIVREPWLESVSVVPASEASGPGAAPDASAHEKATSVGEERAKDRAVQTAVQRLAKVAAEPVGAESAVAHAPEAATAQPPVRPSGKPPAVSSLPGNAWLQALPPTHYTLQLVGARDLGALQKFVKRHALRDELAVFESQFEGRPWFALLQGSYPDRRSALAERAKLPGRLATEAWPRRLQEVHNLIKIKE